MELSLGYVSGGQCPLCSEQTFIPSPFASLSYVEGLPLPEKYLIPYWDLEMKGVPNS